MTTVAAASQPSASSDAAGPPAVRVAGLSHVYPARRVRRKRSRQPDAAAQSASAASQPSGEGGPIQALDDVSFDVQPGEIFGVLGPNGGGKSTLFRILATMLTPTRGDVRILGESLPRDVNAIRQRIGVLFQNPSVDVKLTARENLWHHGRLYGLNHARLDDAIRDNLQRFGLADRAHDAVETFSGGMRRRVEIAKALLHRPDLVLLDEPATGLDPGARRDVWRRLVSLRDHDHVTVMLTTHLMDEAERCDRLAVIHHGKLVAVDTPARLRGLIGGDVVTITPHPDASDDELASLRQQVLKAMNLAPEDLRAAPDGLHFEHPEGPAAVATLAPAVAGQVTRIAVGQPTLEDVFLHLTGHGLHENDATPPHHP